jgi:DNA-binding NtrC family response regulator
MMSTSEEHDPVHAASRPKPPSQVRVLIVEDEASLREQLIRAATDWGFPATPASSGEIAARLNDAHPFDIAILDLGLPGMNGIDTLARLRQRAPNLQGIILTGSATVPAAKAAIHLGIVEFLTKPSNRGELEQAIDRARRRVPSELPVRRGPGECAAAAASSRNWGDVERDHILAAVERNAGDRSQTARELGISRKTLYNKLKAYLRQGIHRS